ncbi:unnamed protein product [Schistosoma turkestanicum]|nr:unnamed protein product [Schistosoma turkestanicum]
MSETMEMVASFTIKEAFQQSTDMKARAQFIEDKFNDYLKKSVQFKDYHIRCVILELSPELEKDLFEYEPDDNYLFSAFKMDNQFILLGDQSRRMPFP